MNNSAFICLELISVQFIIAINVIINICILIIIIIFYKLNFSIMKFAHKNKKIERIGILFMYAAVVV